MLLKRQLALFIYMYVVLFSQTRVVPRWPCAVDGTLKSKNQLTDSHGNCPSCNRIGHSLKWLHFEVFVKGCPPRPEILYVYLRLKSKISVLLCTNAETQNNVSVIVLKFMIQSHVLSISMWWKIFFRGKRLRSIHIII